MDNSILPIDACEAVIDAVRGYTIWNEAYETWRATALVCHAWVSRSRFNMLRDACVWTVSQAQLLRRTIERNPSAADDVHTLCYSFRQAYVPIVCLAAPSLFPKCKKLTLRTDWSRFPPGYLGRIPHGSLGITSLVLHIDGLTASDFFRFVWSLMELRHLEIRGRLKLRKGELGLNENLSDTLSRTKRQAGCAKLEYLDIEVCWSSHEWVESSHEAHRDALRCRTSLPLGHSERKCGACPSGAQTACQASQQ